MSLISTRMTRMEMLRCVFVEYANCKGKDGQEMV